ncbi:MAG: glycosyltransferase family 87 protein [Pseudomonadota bacterium]
MMRQPESGAFVRRFDRCLPASLRADDRGIYREQLLFGGVLFALTAIAYVATISWIAPVPRDGTSLAVGRDFLNFWMYGRSAWSANPSAFYDIGTYHDAIRALLGYSLNGQNWSYPPSVMLLAAPFGKLGYLTALAIWTVLGLALFIAVARRQVSDWRVLLPVMISPAALMCLISGQSAFVTGAVLISVFALLDRRPLVAGFLIGLLTIKPQLGLLFPFFLIASGRWKVFIAAAMTTIAIVAITTAIFGNQVWWDFIQKGLPVQGMVLADPDRIATPFFPTIFMNLRGLDLPYAAAMSVQAVFSMFAIGSLVWAAAKRPQTNPAMTMALFFACTVCASPYLLSYDLVPLTFAAVVLLASGQLDGAGRRIAQLVFWISALQLALGTYHIPGPALIAPVFVAYLVFHLRDAPKTARESA